MPSQRRRGSTGVSWHPVLTAIEGSWPNSVVSEARYTAPAATGPVWYPLRDPAAVGVLGWTRTFCRRSSMSRRIGFVGQGQSPPAGIGRQPRRERSPPLSCPSQPQNGLWKVKESKSFEPAASYRYSKRKMALGSCRSSASGSTRVLGQRGRRCELRRAGSF